MTEREMWEALAGQLEPLVERRPDAVHEWLTGVHREVEDPEFFYLLTMSLGLSKRDDVGEVRRHPHYPGRNLICSRYWCDTGARNRPCPLKKGGRCPLFPEPKEMT
jgi:hypothetical protein